MLQLLYITGRRSRQRRRRLKARVYAIAALLVLVIYQYFQIADLSTTETYIDRYEFALGASKPVSGGSHSVLRNDGDSAISHNTTTFSQYISLREEYFSTALNTTGVRLHQAKQEREPILSILNDAGLDNLELSEILTLPTWTSIKKMYGKDPVVVGLEDSCEVFRKNVPEADRYLGISGMFNSGTTAFGFTLQANCRFSNHPHNKSNDMVSDSNGMLSQVPWAKHKMANEKFNHTIQTEIPKENVLPIVLVRDPYYWMQSMCKQGYGARWSHNPQKHCPNLVPNDFDRKKYRHLHNTSSVPVWMGKNPQVGPSWLSLVHYWNAWYQSYVNADFPRLMIRFEDTLFHGPQVMKTVCKCGGGHLVSPDKHVYLLNEAKWQHKHAQNNMISAMVKYGSDAGRYRNMTADDLDFARTHLDSDLINLFHYRLP